MKTLVLGLGNPILTDDGVGVRVAEAVRFALPPMSGIEVDEVSVGGLRLMERMLGYDRAILVDALQADAGEPGSFRRLSYAELQAGSPTQHSACAHDTSVVTAVEAARRLGLPVPCEIVIYGIAVEDVLSFGETPTPAVAAAIPHVAAAIIEEIGCAPARPAGTRRLRKNITPRMPHVPNTEIDGDLTFDNREGGIT